MAASEPAQAVPATPQALAIATAQPEPAGSISRFITHEIGDPRS